MTQEEMLLAMSTALTRPAGNVPMLGPPAQVDEIVGADEQLAFKFPLDYRLFLQMTPSSSVRCFGPPENCQYTTSNTSFPSSLRGLLPSDRTAVVRRSAICGPNRSRVCSPFPLSEWINRLQCQATSSSC